MKQFVAALSALVLVGFATQANAQLLGTSDNFAVLAATTVTNTGPTVLYGDLGVWPGTEVTGFPPGIVHGTMHLGNAVAEQAQADALEGYNILATQPFDVDLTGQDLGGMVLLPGVYHFDSSAALTGLLILDAQGDPNARFDFQIGSTLTTAGSSVVEMINGGDPYFVHWQVGSSATLGTFSEMLGHVVAHTSITATTGANFDGNLIALNGAVTLDTNTVVPEPATMGVLAIGIAALAARRRRKK